MVHKYSTTFVGRTKGINARRTQFRMRPFSPNCSGLNDFQSEIRENANRFPLSRCIRGEFRTSFANRLVESRCVTNANIGYVAPAINRLLRSKIVSTYDNVPRNSRVPKFCYYLDSWLEVSSSRSVSTLKNRLIAFQRKMELLPPTAEQQRRINEEVPPDPEMRKRDIVAIREWLSKQPHLPNHMGEHIYDCNFILF